MTNQQQLIIKMALDPWNTQIMKADKLFNDLSDEQLQEEVATGRNSGIYLLGHLTAVHDRMLPILNFGELLYPQLVDTFINNPDKSETPIASAGELRQYWKNINSTLADRFNQLQPDEWFQRHNSISGEDFIKEPHRNKLNIIINRTNHLSYHSGQLIFLLKLNE